MEAAYREVISFYTNYCQIFTLVIPLGGGGDSKTGVGAVNLIIFLLLSHLLNVVHITYVHICGVIFDSPELCADE